ncbi:MAG: TPM domain-containing protein [Bacteroidia bacterium]
MKKAHIFSEDDLRRIEEAVKKSETHTSGEIVPVFVNQCGDYSESFYKGVLALSLLAFFSLIVLDRISHGVMFYDPFWYLVVVCGAGLAGGLLVRFVPGLHRWLAGRDRLREMAYYKAGQFFLKEEVFQTVDRTGIMIFVAWFEHQVIVMADKGISKVVAQSAWDQIVDELVTSIKSGKIADGMTKAIEACALLLKEKGVQIQPDDTDELPNQLRME